MRRQDRGYRLLEYGIYNAEKSHQIYDNENEIGEKSPSVRLAVMRKKRATKKDIEHALHQPGT
jgi:hypothetical protein